jgi:hypothetical protein
VRPGRGFECPRESGHTRDRLEVCELLCRERIEHGVRRDGFRARVGTWNAVRLAGMRDGGAGKLGKTESADAERRPRVAREGARQIVCRAA